MSVGRGAWPGWWVLGWLCAGASAQPGGCDETVDCDPPDASGAYVLNEPGPLGYTSDLAGFTPDRRPIAVISPFNGSRSPEDGLGFVPAFVDCPGAEAWLLGELERAWGAGFRRFILNRPGGLPASNGHVAQQQFQHLERWRKAVYADAVGGWFSEKLAEDPDAELGVFIGSTQNNACDPCHTPRAGVERGELLYDCTGTDSTLTRNMSAAERASAELTYQNTRPWIEAGYNAFWFDATSRTEVVDAHGFSEPDTILAMADNPDYAGVKIAGEAVPVARGRPIERYTRGAAWIGLHRFFENSRLNAATLDPGTTEVVCAFQGPEGGRGYPAYDLALVARYRDRGFVLASWRSDSYPHLRRVLDVLDGTLSPRELADFDADGTPDCDDWDLFHARWRLHRGETDTDPAVWDGDADDDGDVDDDDRAHFVRNWRRLGLEPCG
ncbi:MAG: hypothetical protein ACF8Q5_10665 [Phycisphaerales bacterium JB040]